MDESAASRQRRAYGYAALTICCWATVSTAFKVALAGLHHAQVLLLANAVAVGVLACIVLPRGGLQRLRALPFPEHGRCVLLGMMNPAGYYLLLFQAYALLPAQVAQPINYTWAITLSLLAVPLLGQRVGVAEIAAAFLAAAGVFVISLGSGSGSIGSIRWDGVGLALASTLVWAMYWILNARARGDAPCRMLLSFAWGLPASLSACLWFSELPVPGGRTLIAVLWIGVFEMGLSFFFWQRALALSVNAARVTIRRVVVDGVRVDDVQGMVLPQGVLNGTILGMSFLSRLQSFKVQDGVLYLR
ncbi:MAG: EamA family transporter, partial [Gammaproteobacteria bacterium]